MGTLSSSRGRLRLLCKNIVHRCRYGVGTVMAMQRQRDLYTCMTYTRNRAFSSCPVSGCQRAKPTCVQRPVVVWNMLLGVRGLQAVVRWSEDVATDGRACQSSGVRSEAGICTIRRKTYELGSCWERTRRLDRNCSRLRRLARLR